MNKYLLSALLLAVLSNFAVNAVSADEEEAKRNNIRAYYAHLYENAGPDDEVTKLWGTPNLPYEDIRARWLELSKATPFETEVYNKAKAAEKDAQERQELVKSLRAYYAHLYENAGPEDELKDRWLELSKTIEN